MVEASDYKVGKPLRERVILFCYAYDPERGSYQLRVINLVRLFGVLTVLGLALLLWRFRRREKRLALTEEGGAPCSPSFR